MFTIFKLKLFLWSRKQLYQSMSKCCFRISCILDKLCTVSFFFADCLHLVLFGSQKLRSEMVQSPSRPRADPRADFQHCEPSWLQWRYQREVLPWIQVRFAGFHCKNCMQAMKMTFALKSQRCRLAGSMTLAGEKGMT